MREIAVKDAEIVRLRAALADAERERDGLRARVEHMEGVLIDAEDLLGVEETGELILRPIERLQADLAEAREVLQKIIARGDDTDDRWASVQNLARAFLERTATPGPAPPE